MFEEELGTAGEGGCWFGSVEECGGDAGVHGVEQAEVSEEYAGSQGFVRVGGG